MEQATIIGIDLAKRSFQVRDVHGVRQAPGRTPPGCGSVPPIALGRFDGAKTLTSLAIASTMAGAFQGNA